MFELWVFKIGQKFQFGGIKCMFHLNNCFNGSPMIQMWGVLIAGFQVNIGRVWTTSWCWCWWWWLHQFIMVVVIIYISRGRTMNWKSVKWIKNWCLILRGIYILHLDCLTTSWHSFIRNINLSIDMRVSKRLKPPLFKIPCQFYQVVTLCVHLEQNSQHMKVKSQSKSGTGHCPVPLLPLFHLKLHLAHC